VCIRGFLSLSNPIPPYHLRIRILRRGFFFASERYQTTIYMANAAKRRKRGRGPMVGTWIPTTLGKIRLAGLAHVFTRRPSFSVMIERTCQHVPGFSVTQEAKHTPSHRSSLTFGDYTICSAICGSGVQTNSGDILPPRSWTPWALLTRMTE